MISKCIHYSKKMYSLGFKQSASVIGNRLLNIYHEMYWRQLVKNEKAHHSWSDIRKISRIKNFKEYFKTVSNYSFFSFENIAQDILCSKKELLSLADEYTQNCFDLLGSEKQCFSKIPWHSDFRLARNTSLSECSFDKDTFYKDFVISDGQNGFVKDIKIPWELSRCYHFFVLGKAYSLTKDTKYAHTFVDHIKDWIHENPYLCGPNWICPMEVGIRAINWIWGFYFFKNEQLISIEFWEQFVSCLYDHFVYLENNWEIYDGRTSNHYLSDLVGYFYLCYFFKDLEHGKEKADWCFKEIIAEWDKQVFKEGTDYEGSTRYHILVTELFYHFYVICENFGFELPKIYVKKLSLMFDFIDWCTPENGEPIQIGDTDSGKIIYFGLTKNLISSMKIFSQEAVKNYQEFGLSIIRKNRWHISLRHHAYKKNQPSGHFHVDVGSITVSYNGILLIVDPGSYIYTSSKKWRNIFRSVKSHSTCYIQNTDPISLEEHLFGLPIPENTFKNKNQSDRYLHTINNVYLQNGLALERTVEVYDNQIHIRDWPKIIDSISKLNIYEKLVSQLILHPQSYIISQRDGCIHLNQDFYQVKITANLPIQVETGWFAPEYGKKIKTHILRIGSPVETAIRSGMEFILHIIQ